LQVSVPALVVGVWALADEANATANPTSIVAMSDLNMNVFLNCPGAFPRLRAALRRRRPYLDRDP
jgi:hypothetical protein